MRQCESLNPLSHVDFGIIPTSHPFHHPDSFKNGFEQFNNFPIDSYHDQNFELCAVAALNTSLYHIPSPMLQQPNHQPAQTQQQRNNKNANIVERHILLPIDLLKKPTE